MTLASPLAPSGNVSAAYAHVGWSGNQLVVADFSDFFATQRASHGVQLRH